MLETLSLSPTPGTPLDPNFVPPTRPPSALSTRSDASIFALYDESESAPAAALALSSPSADTLPRRTVFATIRRHGQQCLLCGRREIGELVVVRVLMQMRHCDREAESVANDPITQLKELQLLPRGYSRDDWTNLMTLCRPHAEAYHAGTWRWLPNVTQREQFARTHTASASHAHPEWDEDTGDEDVTMTDEQHSLPPESEDGLEPVHAETLVDDGISGDTKNPEINFQPVRLSSLVPSPSLSAPFSLYIDLLLELISLPICGAVDLANIHNTTRMQVEHPSFDVLVFRPESMPPVPPHPESGLTGKHVWREWRKLPLNPYVVLSAALPLLEAGHASDRELQKVEGECLAVRTQWQMARGPVGDVDAESSMQH